MIVNNKNSLKITLLVFMSFFLFLLAGFSSANATAIEPITTTNLTQACNFSGQCQTLDAKSDIANLCKSTCTIAVNKDDKQATLCNRVTGHCIQASADENSDEFNIVQSLCQGINQCRIIVK